MTDEIQLLMQCRQELSEVFHLFPGDRFVPKCGDIIMILDRRLENSDLHLALREYSELLAAQDHTTLDRIVNCAVAYFEIVVLTDAGSDVFDPILKRELIKILNEQCKRTKNILQLSKINLITAMDDKRDSVQNTIEKNEAFLAAYEKKISDTESDLEKNGAYLRSLKEKKSREKETLPDSSESEDRPRRMEHAGKLLIGAVGKIQTAAKKRDEKRIIGEHLIEVEKSAASTRCKEIPYYENMLAFTWKSDCKDLPGFMVLKKKDNIYFGRAGNVGNATYNNADHSLIELTEASEEFLQYMTEDLLSDEYELPVFSESDKASMVMYYEFVSNCFEKYIGTFLNVRDYLRFKSYYNRLVLKVFQLEEQERTDYYRAARLTELYQQYMTLYDMECVLEKDKIINRILADDTDELLQDLSMLKGNHITEKKASQKIVTLMQEIRYFGKKDLFQDVSSVNLEDQMEDPVYGNRITGRLDPTPESLDPAIHFRGEDYNDGLEISAEDINRIRIKTQFLSEKGIIIDEGLFAASNVKRAVQDYLYRRAYIKKIGLYLDEKDVFLFSSKNSSLSVSVLTDEMKHIKRLDRGIQGEIVEFYEEKIRKQMIENAQ